MNSLLVTLGAILRHPLNTSDRLGSIKRYVKWQIGSRLVPGPVLVPFVNETHLIVSPGMTGATQNVYTGLSDFAECSLLLHLLRRDDLFVDIGANVGVYTVLAAGAIGSSAVAVEPVPETFEKLHRNLQVNGIDGRAMAYNMGLGREDAILRFTAGLDTMNRVIAPDDPWAGPSIDVPVTTLDSLLADRQPALIKIDVEGWESEVLAGGSATLRSPSLLALIVETNSQAAELSANEAEVHARLTAEGFRPHAYDPLQRSLRLLSGKNRDSGNTIYARDSAEVARRLMSAPRFRVNGRSF